MLLFGCRINCNLSLFHPAPCPRRLLKLPSTKMESGSRKDKAKQKETPTRGDRAKPKSAQQELKQRQRAEIYALNKVMTELEQRQFEAFCKQMQPQGE